MNQYFFKAAEEKGLEFRDFNSQHAPGLPLRLKLFCYLILVVRDVLCIRSASELGYGPIDFNINGGIRWSTYNAFIRPILNRKNVNIYRYAKAIQVIQQFIYFKPEF